jgi:hypothetical protein
MANRNLYEEIKEGFDTLAIVLSRATSGKILSHGESQALTGPMDSTFDNSDLDASIKSVTRRSSTST